MSTHDAIAMVGQERDLAKHKFKGTREHSVHPLTCSACRAALLDIVVTNPDLDITYKYQADCPHCGDHSFQVPIKGRIVIRVTDHTIYTGADNDDEEMIVYLRTAKGDVAP